MLDSLVLGLGLGAVSAVHCVAMCGPVTAFVAVDRDGTTDPSRVLRYQLGRLVGYGTLGGVLGTVGGALSDLVPGAASALLAIALAASLALAAVQLWPARGRTLVTLGRGPRAASLVDRAARLIARARSMPLVLGIASALLPCGVIGAGALLAASAGSAAAGALAMVGLAVTSGAGSSLAGLGLGRIRLGASPTVARMMAITLALGALITIIRPILALPDADATCHGHS